MFFCGANVRYYFKFHTYKIFLNYKEILHLVKKKILA